MEPGLEPQAAFPHRGHPTGWFQIAWSHEITPGGVRPLRYFGEDLVLYRGRTARPMSSRPTVRISAPTSATAVR